MDDRETAIKHLVDLSDLAGLISYFGLEEFEEAILARARPSKRITATESKKADKITSLGGLPFVPSDFVWPETTDKQPLSFICQIDLSEIGFWAETYCLPPEGILSFFYDARTQPRGFHRLDSSGWRVFHFEDDSILSKMEAPQLKRQTLQFPHANLAFKDELTFPDYQDIVSEGLTFTEPDSYVDFCKSWYQTQTTVQHRLLGYPQLIENDIRLDCQLAYHGVYDAEVPERDSMERAEELRVDCDQWELLLQIDSDEESEMTWGQNGTIYFCIQRDKLLKQDFDQCWLILQSV